MKRLLKLGRYAAMVAAVVAASCKQTPPVEPAPEPNPVHDTEYTIAFTAENGTAKAFMNGTEVTKAKEGDIVSIEAEAADGYIFTGWTSTPVVAFDSATSAATIFTMPAADVLLTAAFELEDVPPPPPPPTTCALNFKAIYEGEGTVSVKVAGEEIESGATVEVDTEVTIAAVADTGYSFTEWRGVTLDDKTASEATFRMPAEDVTLSAIFFELPLYEIIYPSSYMIRGQGSVEIRVDGTGPVADRSKFYAGQSINVKSIPAGGWKLKTIYIIGAPEYANTEPDVTFPMTGLVRITDVIFEEE